MKTSELKILLDNINSYEEYLKLKELYFDADKKSIVNLFNRYEKMLHKNMEILEEYKKRTIYENDLINRGYRFIAGVDEVGRGPFAGAVYASAVILDLENPIYEIKDSKKLSESKRKEIYEKIKNTCISYCVAYATVDEIDKYNILNATKLAMKRAVEGLSVKPDVLLIDALEVDVGIECVPIIKGDDLSVSIGAASIMAKVERDAYMDEMANKYPFYEFDKNKGYGTKKHIEALKRFGSCEIHRKSFIKKYI